MSLGSTFTSAESHLDAAQRWLFDRITRPLGMPTPDPDADARWVTSGRLPSAERIAVYQRAYFSRLVGCLRDDYPALAHALGADEFEALCMEFVETHPPESASLNHYGAPFADFCATRPTQQAPFLSELARLEWAVVECIHADAERSLDARELGAISEAQWALARLIPSPAARLLGTTHAVHAHYRAFLAGETPEPPAVEACTIAVCRRGDPVKCVEVAPRLAGLLQRLMSGEPLASALADVPDDAGAAGELERALTEWVACGLFAGIAFDGGLP